MKRKFYLVLSLLIVICSLTACGNKSAKSRRDNQISIVTSTNIYADLAKSVVGKYGKVQAIINNGDIDPHDFEASFNSAKEVADANILISNGLGYDNWMDKLAKSNDEKVIKVGENILGKKTGDNPHIWYDLKMPKMYIKFILNEAIKKEPEHKQYFKTNAEKSFKELAKIEKIAKSIDGKKSKPVFVSEPVFDYALEDCQFKIGNEQFEKAVENETDPSASIVHAMQKDIEEKKIAFFVNNTQASSSTVKNFVKLCQKKHIPVLNVRETMPNGVSYLEWMKLNYEKLAEVSK